MIADLILCLAPLSCKIAHESLAWIEKEGIGSSSSWLQWNKYIGENLVLVHRMYLTAETRREARTVAQNMVFSMLPCRFRRCRLSSTSPSTPCSSR